jgi:hypothetical protein
MRLYDLAERPISNGILGLTVQDTWHGHHQSVYGSILMASWELVGSLRGWALHRAMQTAGRNDLPHPRLELYLARGVR